MPTVHISELMTLAAIALHDTSIVSCFKEVLLQCSQGAEGLHLHHVYGYCLPPWVLCPHASVLYVAVLTPHCTGNESMPILKFVLPAEAW